MKIEPYRCPQCGAMLNVATEKSPVLCQYCGSALIVSDEKLHIRFENMEKAGYEFEKGRQRAQTEQCRQFESINTEPLPQKKSNTWLWIIGWLFCFPIPLTILVFRSKSLTEAHKRTYLWILGWILFFPVPMTILILRNKNLSKSKKILILIIIYALLLTLGAILGFYQQTPQNDPMTTEVKASLVQEFPIWDTTSAGCDYHFAGIL